MTLLEISRRLHKLGHAPEFPKADEAFLSWVLSDVGRELIKRYEAFHHLPVTGANTPALADHLALPRCGHPDLMAVAAGESSWALASLGYSQSIAYAGIDPAEVAAEYAEALRRMTAVCGMTLHPATAAEAQILAVAAPIDGEWNVLALTELPPPGGGAGLVLHQTFDLAELGLTEDQRIAMMAHECGHFLGLGHALPGSGNLMEPVLSSITSPQAGDVAELVARYGPPATVAPPAPAAPGATATTQAGASASTVVVSVPAAGSFQFSFNFDVAGDYLLVIVSPK